MARTAESYERLLHNLTPFGKVWNRDRNSNWSKLLRGLSEELFRVELATRDLAREAFGDRATIPFLLTDFERLLALPDECTPVLPATEAERQQLVKARLTARGGQTPQYFIDIALSLGFDSATISEGAEPITCESDCDAFLNIETDVFLWVITLKGPGDFATTECLIRAFAPAHTLPIFVPVI